MRRTSDRVVVDQDPTPEQNPDPVAALLPASFRAFHELYAGELLRYALLHTGQRADAEDAVEAALVRLFQIWDRAMRHEQPLALAYQVLHGKIVDGRRRTRRCVPTDFAAAGAPDPSDPAGDPSDHVAAFADLDAALDRLPLRQRECARLHFLIGLDAAEVAARLGITASAVRSHLHLARKHLAAALGLDDTGPPRTPARARAISPSRKESTT
ncbi:RNA polymerase sigma factor [Streptodolium elevatio]